MYPFLDYSPTFVPDPKYEFGKKVSIVYTQNTGVIVEAMGFGNEYGGHTLD